MGRSAVPEALAVLKIEFVAKPDQAQSAQSTIPTTLAMALKEVSGFAGCLVMSSDQEARLVTVVTLWMGGERMQRCRENARWVQKLLAPYQDRCLRVQTLTAYWPAPEVTWPEAGTLDEHAAFRTLRVKEEEICAA